MHVTYIELEVVETGSDVAYPAPCVGANLQHRSIYPADCSNQLLDLVAWILVAHDGCNGDKYKYKVHVRGLPVISFSLSLCEAVK